MARKNEFNKSYPSVWIIIINWNRWTDTEACLKSLEDLTYPNFSVLVVDNGSTDGSVERLKRLNGINTILLKTNEGFVGGNNIGVDYARKHQPDYFLLLNNDTLVDAHFLSRLVTVLESTPDIGIAGPLICYAGLPDTIWSAGGSIDLSRGETSMVGIGQKKELFDSRSPFSVDFVTGCALLVKRQVIDEIGFLDDRFFAYYEETEFCVRARKNGWGCVVVPQALIWHKITPEARAASENVHYYMTRNRLLFIRLSKMGWLVYLRALAEDLRTLVSWSIRLKWKNQRRLRKAHIQALMDNLGNRWGKRIVRAS